MHWYQNLNRLTVSISPQLDYWLRAVYRMSEALSCQFGQISIQVVEENWIEPYCYEIDFLRCQPQQTWCRRTLLCHQETALIYARVAIPEITVAMFPQLKQLGAELLGANFLYRQNEIKRSRFYFARLQQDDELMQEVSQAVPVHSPLWGRCSRFNVQSYPLLVTEVLLPSVSGASTQES